MLWLQSEDVIGSCVFWQIGVSQRKWLTHGCVRVEHESSARVTTCECDHLTVFAVLMNNKPARKLFCIPLKIRVYEFQFRKQYVRNKNMYIAVFLLQHHLCFCH